MNDEYPNTWGYGLLLSWTGVWRAVYFHLFHSSNDSGSSLEQMQEAQMKLTTIQIAEINNFFSLPTIHLVFTNSHLLLRDKNSLCILSCGGDLNSPLGMLRSPRE